MAQNPTLLFLVVMLATLVVLGIPAMMLSRPSRMKKRMDKLAALAAVDADTPLTRSPLGEGLERMLSSIGVDTQKMHRDLYVPLGRVGVFSPDAPVYLFLFKWVMQPVLALAGLGFLALWLMSPERASAPGLLKLLVGLVLLVIGLFGSTLYLNNMRQRREFKLTRSFPDSLDLLLVCVESGLSLDTALAKVCKEMRDTSPEMTLELDRTRMELNILGDREQALRNLAERTNTIGFRSLVSSLLQSEKFGTNLSDTLRVLSDEFRTTRLLQAENKAARIPTIITIPLILCILFPTLALIAAPPVIKVNQMGGMFKD